MKRLERVFHLRLALEETETNLRYDRTRRKISRQTFHIIVAAPSDPLAVRRQEKGDTRLAPVQWLVPSENVILFHTLYLPDGRDIGMRFTSVKVAAS